MKPDHAFAAAIDPSRRAFMASTSGVAVAAVTAGCAATVDRGGGLSAPLNLADERAPRAVRLLVNGQPRDVTLSPRVTLLDALRDQLLLTGTKKGCDRGQCGACTVLLEGRRVNACLTLAVMAEGLPVTTIEGLGTPQALHPMQAAFLQHDGFQCGYCTPGQICSAVALLTEFRDGHASAVTAVIRADLRTAPQTLDDDEIRERMSGNLCRCGAYPNIVAAVRQVAGPLAGATGACA